MDNKKVPQWLKDKARMECKGVSALYYDEAYKAYIKGAMSMADDAIGFLTWVREKRLITNGVIWKYEGEQVTEADLYAIYKQQPPIS